MTRMGKRVPTKIDRRVGNAMPMNQAAARLKAPMVEPGMLHKEERNGVIINNNNNKIDLYLDSTIAIPTIIFWIGLNRWPKKDPSKASSSSGDANAERSKFQNTNPEW